MRAPNCSNPHIEKIQMDQNLMMWDQPQDMDRVVKDGSWYVSWIFLRFVTIRLTIH